MRTSTAALLAAALLVPGAASAQVASVADVRCLITMAGVANNEQIRTQAVAGIYFYAARLLDRQPNFAFASVRAEAEKMSKADFDKELVRCGAELNGAAQKLAAAQAALQNFAPKN